MLELKADGQAELELLKLLLPSGAQVSLTGSSLTGSLVPAATQQRLDKLNYVIQTQQEQLAQAQTAITDYQRALAALTAQSSQPRRLPASPTEGSGLALSGTPRRYITGGLGQGQSKAITARAQTAPFFERPHRHRLGVLAMSGSKRLIKPSLVLMLFCLVFWVVFRYAAPLIGNQLLQTTPEPAPAPKQESEPPKPQSNLDKPTPSPGSAASKAGTQPNAL
ncbi:MAG: hypothetical protein DCF15_21715, partial [Phormidesmis priestleyi]